MYIPTPSTGGVVGTIPTLPRISDFGLGDNKTIVREVEGITSPIVSASFVVKSQPSDTLAQAVINNPITTGLTAAGQITDNGQTSLVAHLQFELTGVQTGLLANTKYYTIAMTTLAGDTFVLEHGHMKADVPTADPDSRRKSINWQFKATSPEPPHGATKALPRELIDDLDQGETYTFTRRITNALPAGYSGYVLFTVRQSATDLDAGAIAQKTVTPSAFDTASNSSTVTITLTPTDTAKMVGPMVWDAKYVINNGGLSKYYTVAEGTISAQGAIPNVGVVKPPVQSMAIQPPPPISFLPVQLVLNMADGGSHPLNPVVRQVAWGSLNPSIATVSPTGLVSGVTAGITDIVATVEGIEVRTTVTVQTLVFSVVPSPSPLTVIMGQPGTPLSVVVKDAANNILTGRTILYTTSNPSIATVSTTGVVTAVGVGSATITVSVEGIVAQVVTTVSASASAVFKYTTGDSTASGYTFANSSGSNNLRFNADGSITAKGANTLRDDHYLGAVRTTLLEPATTNRVLYSNDVSNTTAWTRVGSPITTSGLADPFGGSAMCLTSDTDTSNFQYVYQTPSLGADGAQMCSAIVKRGLSNPQYALLFDLYDGTASVTRSAVAVNWTSAGAPVISFPSAYGGGTCFMFQVGSGNYWWIVSTLTGSIAANANSLNHLPGVGAGAMSGSASATAQGDIYSAHQQIENGTVATTPVLNPAGSQQGRSADVLTYTVPGGAGQSGTLYEKYYDMGTGALVEQVSAYTTSATYVPQTGRAWISWKFALGTQTLPAMRAL